MSIQYSRPKTIDEALTLLEQEKPRTVPMGGGTSFGQYSGEPITVLDLQALHLDGIKIDRSETTIGSMVTLSNLEKNSDIPDFIREACRKELNENLRNSATLGGVLFSGSPRSILSIVLNAVDSKLIWLPQKTAISYGEFLAQKTFWKKGKLIEAIEVPQGVRVLFDFISRTPDDVPFLILAIAKWPNGRIRIVIGGTGPSQIVVTDGLGVEGIESGIKNACSHTNDHWASSEYRSEVGAILFRRLHSQLQAVK